MSALDGQIALVTGSTRSKGWPSPPSSRAVTPTSPCTDRPANPYPCGPSSRPGAASSCGHTPASAPTQASGMPTPTITGAVGQLTVRPGRAGSSSSTCWDPDHALPRSHARMNATAEPWIGDAGASSWTTRPDLESGPSAADPASVRDPPQTGTGLTGRWTALPR